MHFQSPFLLLFFVIIVMRTISGTVFFGYSSLSAQPLTFLSVIFKEPSPGSEKTMTLSVPEDVMVP